MSKAKPRSHELTFHDLVATGTNTFAILPFSSCRVALTIANDSSLHRHWWSYWRKPCCSWASILLNILAALYTLLLLKISNTSNSLAKTIPQYRKMKPPCNRASPSIPGSSIPEPLATPHHSHDQARLWMPKLEAWPGHSIPVFFGSKSLQQSGFQPTHNPYPIHIPWSMTWAA